MCVYTGPAAVSLVCSQASLLAIWGEKRLSFFLWAQKAGGLGLGKRGRRGHGHGEAWRWPRPPHFTAEASESKARSVSSVIQQGGCSTGEGRRSPGQSACPQPRPMGQGVHGLAVVGIGRGLPTPLPCWGLGECLHPGSPTRSMGTGRLEATQREKTDRPDASVCSHGRRVSLANWSVLFCFHTAAGQGDPG